MKTVYILGAGFSKPAGAPVQFELIEDIVIVLTNRNPSLGGKKVRDYLH